MFGARCLFSGGGGGGGGGWGAKGKKKHLFLLYPIFYILLYPIFEWELMDLIPVTSACVRSRHYSYVDYRQGGPGM